MACMAGEFAAILGPDGFLVVHEHAGAEFARLEWRFLAGLFKLAKEVRVLAYSLPSGSSGLPMSKAPRRYSSPTDISFGSCVIKVNVASGKRVHTSRSSGVTVTKPKKHLYRPGSLTRPTLSQLILFTRICHSIRNQRPDSLWGSGP